MILTSKKWLLLLVYILLMPGCAWNPVCIPVPSFSTPPVPPVAAIHPPPLQPKGEKDGHETAPPSVVEKEDHPKKDAKPGTPSPATDGPPKSAESPKKEEKSVNMPDKENLPCLTGGKDKYGRDKFGIRYYYRHEKDTGFFIRIKDGETLSIGDRYFIKFVLDAKCYVYVYQVENDSKITDLVKLSGGSHDKPFKEGKEHPLPSDEDDPFQLGQSNGRNVAIYFLASKERKQDLEQQYDTFSKDYEDYEKQKPGSTFNPQEKLKPLLKQLKDESKDESEALKWLGTTLTFSITTDTNSHKREE